MADDDIWFEQKRFGYGAGLPIRWQGWALLGGYIAVVLGLNYGLRPQHPLPSLVIVVMATIAMAVTAARHTRGGWRWRW